MASTKNAKAKLLIIGEYRPFTVKSWEPMGVIEVSMEQHRNERAGEIGDPRENSSAVASSGTISKCKSPGAIPPRIEPGSLRWTGSCLNYYTACHRSAGPWRRSSSPIQGIRARFPVEPHSDLRMWGSCRTPPLVGGFSQGSPASPSPALSPPLHTSFQPRRLSRLYSEQLISASIPLLPVVAEGDLLQGVLTARSRLGAALSRHGRGVNKYTGAKLRVGFFDVGVPISNWLQRAAGSQLSYTGADWLMAFRRVGDR
ncbi:hypothetical protein PR048_025422 [Dryococelus australis]|uniref:Uncharacterized protein n=1 Tax=Dryococelus australis TaxID=614101 RepID=A0ABQ9GRE3_9NEOP|nr:hypothetical protein PR048_025422 [Dryococelus australis]